MQSFGQPLNILSTIDSTNNYAMQMAHARMAKHGAAWFAHEQTGGKGQRGKSWKNNAGENISLSILTEPTFLSPENPFLLMAVFALGAFDFVKIYVPDEIKIKWPNDIYWCDRKAGGILIESIIQGKLWKYAVAGIGLNINQADFDNSLSRAVSLKQITGNTYDVISLARELCICTEKRYQQLQSGDTANLLQDYHYALYSLDSVAALRFEDGRTERCIIKGVTPTGQLMLAKLSGEIMLCNWGTVGWILPDL